MYYFDSPFFFLFFTMYDDAMDVHLRTFSLSREVIFCFYQAVYPKTIGHTFMHW